MGGSRQHLLRRLQHLYHHGYLDRPRAQIDYYRHGSAPMVYGMGPKGIKLLEQRLGIPHRKGDWTARNRSVNRYFLEHTLAVAEVMVKLELACRTAVNVQLINATPPHEAPFKWQVTFHNSGGPLTLGVVPDRAFGLRIAGQPDAWFFLEADRATMPVARGNLKQTSFLRKLLAYHHTWRQQLLADKSPRFRVLTVTTTIERVRHLIDAQLQASQGRGGGLFLFTDRDSFLGNGDPLHALLLNGRGETVTLLN